MPGCLSACVFLCNNQQHSTDATSLNEIDSLAIVDDDVDDSVNDRLVCMAFGRERDTQHSGMINNRGFQEGHSVPEHDDGHNNACSPDGMYSTSHEMMHSASASAAAIAAAAAAALGTRMKNTHAHMQIRLSYNGEHDEHEEHAHRNRTRS